MTRAPQLRYLADGKRLHLQDGPIDLIVEANGTEASVGVAYSAAARRFTGLLDELFRESLSTRSPFWGGPHRRQTPQPPSLRTQSIWPGMLPLCAARCVMCSATVISARAW